MSCQQSAEQIEIETKRFEKIIASGAKPTIKAVGAPVGSIQKHQPSVKSDYSIF